MISPKLESSVLVDNSFVRSKFVRRYFTPDYYNENGTLGFVADSSQIFNLNYQLRQVSQISIVRSKIEFFSMRWFDTSSISLIDFGNKFDTYSTEFSSSVEIDTESSGNLFGC